MNHSVSLLPLERFAQLVADAAHGVRPRWLGVYQHRYADSFADPNVSTHYVVLAHAMDLPPGLSLPAADAPDSQHSSWQWWDVAAASTSAQVHRHTQDYLFAGRAVLGGATIESVH